MEVQDYKPPSDKDIEKAQEILGVTFHPDYVEFIKSGYDMGDSILEPLEINAQGSHVDIFEVVKTAWDLYGVPRDLLPIVEDNADFYCMNSNGEIQFWSHNGLSDEKWEYLKTWRDQMIEEANG